MPFVCSSHFYCRKPGELSASGLQQTLLLELVSLCLSLLHELTCACCLCALQFLGLCPGASSTVLLPIVLFLSSLLGEFGSRRSSAKGGQSSRAPPTLLSCFSTVLLLHLSSSSLTGPPGSSLSSALGQQQHLNPVTHLSIARALFHFFALALLHFFALHLHCYTSLQCTAF